MSYNFKDFDAQFPDDGEMFSSLLAGLTPAKAAEEASI